LTFWAPLDRPSTARRPHSQDRHWYVP